jgi:ABC-type polysaccharide/polyol phosphate export permease
MDKLKRYLGIIWILIGPALFVLLLISAFNNINGHAKGDISNPIPWIIILGVFLPIAAGLSIFGWYAFTGNYNAATNETMLPDREVF